MNSNALALMNTVSTIVYVICKYGLIYNLTSYFSRSLSSLHWLIHDYTSEHAPDTSFDVWKHGQNSSDSGLDREPMIHA
jgi:hypothetical protein